MQPEKSRFTNRKRRESWDSIIPNWFYRERRPIRILRTSIKFLPRGSLRFSFFLSLSLFHSSIVQDRLVAIDLPSRSSRNERREEIQSVSELSSLLLSTDSLTNLDAALSEWRFDWTRRSRRFLSPFLFLSLSLFFPILPRALNACNRGRKLYLKLSLR